MPRTERSAPVFTAVGIAMVGLSACANEEPRAAAFEAITPDDLVDTLGCDWREMELGDSFEWPVEPSAVGRCNLPDDSDVGMALFDEAGGAAAYAALVPCLFDDYPKGDYYYAVGDAWVAAGDELERDLPNSSLKGSTTNWYT